MKRLYHGVVTDIKPRTETYHVSGTGAAAVIGVREVGWLLEISHRFSIEVGESKPPDVTIGDPIKLYVFTTSKD